ncbi:MAG: GNAT family N-acetyltransferase [Solirubrobacterales bacterium]
MSEESETGDDAFEIGEASEADLPELLPLMRGYCNFYGTKPTDEGIEAMARALIGGDGVVFEARPASGDGPIAGFATSAIKWSMLRGARVALLDDLFVDSDARGKGLADRLILACADWGRARDAVGLEWQTGLDNERAKKVYERLGAKPSRWLDYELELGDVPGRSVWKHQG